MFTGLVEAVGELRRRTPGSGGVQLQIAAPFVAELALGDSVAVNGVCLTVVARDEETFVADAGPETLLVTSLGALEPESAVNLERPLVAGGRLGGHFVQGHVDAVGKVLARRPAEEFEWLTVQFPPELAPLLVLKGSVAVDGVSLTVARLKESAFDVQVVPYTIEHTNIGRMRPGDPVNLEVDMVGKYVARAVALYGLDRSVPQERAVGPKPRPEEERE
jgi:riboflavin synthase